MMPADRRQSVEESDEVVEVGGLTGGLTAWHLRFLCENPYNGGGGYSPREVGEWTLNQIWFRLCELDALKEEVGMRTKTVEPLAMKSGGDGMIRGRAADGTPIQGRIRGKSKVAQILERKERKKRRRARRQRKAQEAILGAGSPKG